MRLKQFTENILSKQENKKLQEVAGGLRSELEEKDLLKRKFSKFTANLMRDLYNLQDVNSLGINEESKRQHRNVIINKMIKNNLDIINELDASGKHYLVQ